MTRSPLNSLHGSAQFPERRRGAMPGYSTLDLGRVTHGSGRGVPLGHLAGGSTASGRSFRIQNFPQRKQSARSTPRANADVLHPSRSIRMQTDLNAAIRSLVIFVARASGNDTGDEAQ